MKRLILNIILFLPLLTSAQQKYILNVKGRGFPSTSKAYLYYRKDNKIHRDSSSMENGIFHFSGNVEIAKKAIVALSPKGIPIANVNNADKASLYLENGDILVETKDSLISHAKVSGTPLNGKQQELNESLASLSKGSELYYSAQDAFISKNKASIVSLNILRSDVDPSVNPLRAQKLFDKLSPDLRNTVEGKNYQSWINAVVAVSVGHMAPEFTSKNPDNKQVSLESYRGKYVLIDFWASWCRPCRQENPNLKAAYGKYGSKNFTILSISLDGGTNGKKLWLDAIEQDGLPWEQISDLDGGDGKIPRMYMVEIIPANYLIDPSGKIIAKNLRGKELDKKLAEILGS